MLQTISDYSQYKQTLDGELKKSAEGFVRIGYLLKLARDTNILEGSGYSDVISFAKTEYNLDKSSVSRFININERFAHGNENLLPQYEDMGVAKLALMLTLPDEINENLTADYTKSEIQSIKEELDEEKKVTDIEVMLEGQSERMADMETDEKVIHQMLHDFPELLKELAQIQEKAIAAGRPIIEKEIAEMLAPSDTKSYSVRIQGEGRYMVMINGTDKDIRIISMRTSETIDVPWGGITVAFSKIASLITEYGLEEYYRKAYGEEYPVKEEKKAENPKVAPVQPKAQEPKKESRVVKAPTPAPKKEPEPAILQEKNVSEAEIQENVVSEPVKEAESIDFAETEHDSEKANQECDKTEQDNAKMEQNSEEYGEVEEIEEIEAVYPEELDNEQQADVIDMPHKEELIKLREYQDKIIDKYTMAIKAIQDRLWDSAICRMAEASDLIMDARLIEEDMNESDEDEE